jgi:CxxC motif-containing protein (DUF1111 family)
MYLRSIAVWALLLLVVAQYGSPVRAQLFYSADGESRSVKTALLWFTGHWKHVRALVSEYTFYSR